MWFLLLPLLSHAATDSDQSPILSTLSGDGKIVAKNEKKSFGEHCSAERKWSELENAGNGTAKINAAVRKECTVGKALTASDCPSREDTENLGYYNESHFAGQKGRLVSTLLTVYFPGGSGRYARRCTTYDLDSGRKVHLDKHLTDFAKKKLAAAYCREYPKKATKYCDSYAKQACLLVAADGLRAELPSDVGWKFGGPTVMLPWSDALQVSPELKEQLGL